jgi:tetratricopeptide (TPR) repeat protein
MDQGDRYFESGDYASAVSAYLAYLREEPQGGHRDRVLYRLGLALALPSNPARDPNQAIAYLDQLAADYPKSPLGPEAGLIAALERESLDLHAEMEQREQQLAALNRQLDALKEQQGAVDQLRSDLKDREDRIHELSDELEKLKAIDLQRRPTAPPAR